MNQQNKSYLGSLVQFSRTFVSERYNQLPIKSSFVESIAIRADRMATPYLDSVTDIVDKSINKSILIVSDYEQRIGLAEQGLKLKQKGLEIQNQIKVEAKKVVGQTESVKNQAQVYLVNTWDRIANSVFSSIEGRVEQLQLSILKDTKKAVAGQQQQISYHKRVSNLAQNITQVSYGLLELLQNQLEGARLFQVKTVVFNHLNAIYTSVTLQFITPSVLIYTTRKEELIQIIKTLQSQLTKQGLKVFLWEQCNLLKQLLTVQQFKIYTALLLTTLKELNIIQFARSSIQQFTNNYKQSLELSTQNKIQIQNENAATPQIELTAVQEPQVRELEESVQE